MTFRPTSLIQSCVVVTITLVFVATGLAQPSPSRLERNDHQNADQEHMREGVEAHRVSKEWSDARVAWSSLVKLAKMEVGFVGFSPADRLVVQSITQLDRRSIERQAVEPIVHEICSLPRDHDIVALGELMNKAERAQYSAFDAAIAPLLQRLTPDGFERLDDLTRRSNVLRSSIMVDWEALAKEMPQVARAMVRKACDLNIP